MKKFLNEFKAFAMKGNVVNMAVGVVIGGAFGKIVTSLVNDIIMPLVTLMTGAADFTELRWVLVPEVLNEANEVVSAGISINYGAFLQNIIDFLIVALAIFCVIKAINKLSDLRKKEEAEKAPETPKGPTAEELLVEIRDLLKDK